MEHLTIAMALLVAGGSLAMALALWTSRDGTAASPWQLAAAFALTLPAQALLAATAFLLYVGIRCSDPDRLCHVVVASSALLAVAGGLHVRRIARTPATAGTRALAIGCTIALAGLALAALLGAAYG